MRTMEGSVGGHAVLVAAIGAPVKAPRLPCFAHKLVGAAPYYHHSGDNAVHAAIGIALEN